MRRLNYSNVTATIALVVAVGGGTAGAAAVLKPNSVGSAQIRPGAVRSSDIHHGAVGVRQLTAAARGERITKASVRDAVTEVLTDPATGINIKVTGETGPAGPAGPAGPQGAPGVTAITVRDGYGQYTNNDNATGASAQCLAGERVLGGGARFEGGGQDAITLVDSYPLSDPVDGWTVTYSVSGVSAGRAHAWAVCAKLG